MNRQPYRIRDRDSGKVTSILCYYSIYLYHVLPVKVSLRSTAIIELLYCTLVSFGNFESPKDDSRYGHV
jgi:hypothetical protein